MCEIQLLNYNQILDLIMDSGPNKIANILKIAINKNCFMRYIDGERLYIKKPENYYKQYRDSSKIDTELKIMVTLIIENSITALSKDEMFEIKDKFKKYKFILKNTFVVTILPQLKHAIMCEEDSKFIKSLDSSLYELHYKNGYLDMKTGEFHDRNVAIKPVTYIIPRVYKTPTKKNINTVETVFKTFMTNPEDLDILMMIIAGSLTGDSTKDQNALFMLGDGSNGKSLFLDLIQYAFGDYVQILDKQTFEKGYAKQEKILNQFLINVYIRIAYINEFSDRPIDTTIFKNFCDGKITTTSLFKDGQNTILHRAKAICAMNMFPKIILDGGSKRRIDAITGHSIFKDYQNEVDESKHIYLKDKEMSSRFQRDDGILNAIVYVVVQYSIRIANGEKINTCKNENMKTTRQEILNSNDSMKDFFDSQLIITNDQVDNVSKNSMLKHYKLFNEKSMITLNQIIAELKKASIVYNSNIRNQDGTRGCFVGVRLKYADDNDNDDNINSSMFIKPDDKAEYIRVEEYKKIKDELDEAKKYILELELKLKLELEKEIVEKQIVEKEIVEKQIVEKEIVEGKKPTKKNKMPSLQKTNKQLNFKTKQESCDLSDNEIDNLDFGF